MKKIGYNGLLATYLQTIHSIIEHNKFNVIIYQLPHRSLLRITFEGFSIFRRVGFFSIPLLPLPPLERVS